MTIEARTLHILEYAKIRERLAQHTSFSASRQLALQLQHYGAARRRSRPERAA
jgi:DNA mismatch repair protein MutS2